jgi:hypothetical protein
MVPGGREAMRKEKAGIIMIIMDHRHIAEEKAERGARTDGGRIMEGREVGC